MQRSSGSARRIRQNYKRKRVVQSQLGVDWALSNIEMTERRKKIMDILAQKRLLTIDQLLYFHSDYKDQSQSKSLLQRQLCQLYSVYMIDKAYTKPIQTWDGETKRTQLIALGLTGSQYVGFPKHYERIKRKGKEVTVTTNAHHTIQTHFAEIVTRETMKELDCEVTHWIHECGKKIVGHQNELNPDAFCMIRDKTNNQLIHFFFEYDTGSMDRGRRTKFPSLNQKFDKYKEVMVWDEWYKKPVSLGLFPHLFFVTEDAKRLPGVPNLLNEKGIPGTVCLKQDFADQLREFIRNVRR